MSGEPPKGLSDKDRELWAIAAQHVHPESDVPLAPDVVFDLLRDHADLKRRLDEAEAALKRWRSRPRNIDE